MLIDMENARAKLNELEQQWTEVNAELEALRVRRQAKPFSDTPGEYTSRINALYDRKGRIWTEFQRAWRAASQKAAS